MSRDQRPGKVKLYSGSGKPMAGGPASQGRAAAPPPAVAASASAWTADAAAPESARSTGAWILVLLFIIGGALGGGLFTAFVPF